MLKNAMANALQFDATILQNWLMLDLESKAEDQISFQLK